MDRCCFLLLLTAIQAVTPSQYYQDNQYQQCANSGEARFGFPVAVGNITGNTDIVSPSGLAHSRRFSNVLYFINDVAGVNIVHAINANNGNIIGSITITDATNVDWEDVTVGVCPSGIIGSCIYVQDAGSDEPGPANVIYVVKEERDPAKHISKKADKVLKYNFQPGNKVKKNNGLFVDCQGDIFFFDSPDGGLGARLYQLKYIDGQYTAVGVLQIDLPSTDDGPIALSLSADCCELLIKMDDKIYYFSIDNGQIKPESLQVLPYTPDDEEEAITWGPRQDRYYIISEEEPYTLKVAVRGINVPDPLFSLGRTVGTIDDKKLRNIVGLATSRIRLGFLYAVSKLRLDKVLIVQIFQAQTVGAIELDTENLIMISDIATGLCPSSFSRSNCIYVSAVVSDGKLGNSVFVFEEPENSFAVTSQTIGASNKMKFTLPSGGRPGAIMIGDSGEIYVFDVASEKETVSLYQLTQENGNTTAIPMTKFSSPSIESGPVSADISPCFNEIIIKFRDIVLLFDVRHKNVANAFSKEPSYLPYLPEEEGQSVAFSGCNNYLTTSSKNEAVPLTAYNRVQRQSGASRYRY